MSAHIPSSSVREAAFLSWVSSVLTTKSLTERWAWWPKRFTEERSCVASTGERGSRHERETKSRDGGDRDAASAPEVLPVCLGSRSMNDGSWVVRECPSTSFIYFCGQQLAFPNRGVDS